MFVNIYNTFVSVKYELHYCVFYRVSVHVHACLYVYLHCLNTQMQYGYANAYMQLNIWILHHTPLAPVYMYIKYNNMYYSDMYI